MKVIESLKTIAISLKRTTRKNTSQEGGFLNFLRPLMRAGLPLMKSLITPLAKIFFISSSCSISTEHLWIMKCNAKNFK